MESPQLPKVALTDLLIEPKLAVLDHMKALPEAPMAEGKEEHEVEAILDTRMRWNRLEYLVKWKV